MNQEDNWKKMYEYINDKWISEYDELEECNIFPLPEEVVEEVEIIIKVKKDISDEDLGILEYLIGRDISKSSLEILEEYYRKPYILILSRY